MENRRLITEGWATGLTGTLGVQIVSAAGTVLVARTTAGITESPVGSGRYVKTYSADPANYPIEHIWDNAVDWVSGLISHEVSKVKIREAVGGLWTNEVAETVEVTITDAP